MASSDGGLLRADVRVEELSFHPDPHPAPKGSPQREVLDTLAAVLHSYNRMRQHFRGQLSREDRKRLATVEMSGIAMLRKYRCNHLVREDLKWTETKFFRNPPMY